VRGIVWRHLPRSLCLAIVLATPTRLVSQNVSLRVGRNFISPNYLTGWFGYSPIQFGSFDAALTVGSMGHASGTLYGFGTDLSLGLVRRWSAVGGAALGFGRGSEAGDWSTWSLGARYDLLRRPFGLGVEGRYRRLFDPDRSGLEVAAVLRIPVGSGSSEPRDTPPVDLPLTASAARIVQVAEEAMGTPYLWGGSNSNGFDCSGLIQFAYAEAGFTLPRRSVDQARTGRAVVLEVSSLQPADILAFAENGSAVSHVGLYLGAGRFIHSSSRGVRISRLDPSDPDGSWWHSRWVGVRRVVETEP